MGGGGGCSAGGWVDVGESHVSSEGCYAYVHSGRDVSHSEGYQPAASKMKKIRDGKGRCKTPVSESGRLEGAKCHVARAEGGWGARLLGQVLELYHIMCCRPSAQSCSLKPKCTRVPKTWKRKHARGNKVRGTVTPPPKMQCVPCDLNPIECVWMDCFCVGSHPEHAQATASDCPSCRSCLHTSQIEGILLFDP